MLSRVSPFRDPWITGYVLLPMAYRSLSRLSSALSAKASTLCPFLLDLVCTQPSVAGTAFSFRFLLRILDEIELFFFLIFDVGMQFSRCYEHLDGDKRKRRQHLTCDACRALSEASLLRDAAELSSSVVLCISSSSFRMLNSLRLRQPPTLPRRLQRSTIGRPGLNRRVRYGNGCAPHAYRHQILRHPLMPGQ